MAITAARWATAVTANTDTALFQVAASHEYGISILFVCNQGSTERTFRIAVVDAAIANVAAEDYIAYDQTIAALTTIPIEIKGKLPATYSILVRANHAEVTFLALGYEEDV